MRKWNMILLFLLSAVLLTACGKEKKVESDEVVYYLNKNATAIVAEPYVYKSDHTEEKIEEMLKVLSKNPKSVDYKNAVPEQVVCTGIQLTNGQLYLDFSGEYLNMDRASEVLMRAAVVNTVCQLEEVSYVGFTIAGEELTDSKGNIIGLMNEHSFLDNTLGTANATKIAKLSLYYANKSGDALKAYNCVVEYNANVSLEKLVVEKLIAGPSEKGYYAAIPQNTKIINVSTKEGVCYVNLDSGFTEQGYDVLSSVTIYSIVNSLSDLPGITGVQILVNGDTSLTYKNSLSLETIFQKNIDLIERDENL